LFDLWAKSGKGKGEFAGWLKTDPAAIIAFNTMALAWGKAGMGVPSEKEMGITRSATGMYTGGFTDSLISSLTSTVKDSSSQEVREAFVGEAVRGARVRYDSMVSSTVYTPPEQLQAAFAQQSAIDDQNERDTRFGNTRAPAKSATGDANPLDRVTRGIGNLAGGANIGHNQLAVEKEVSRASGRITTEMQRLKTFTPGSPSYNASLAAIQADREFLRQTQTELARFKPQKLRSDTGASLHAEGFEPNSGLGHSDREGITTWSTGIQTRLGTRLSEVDDILRELGQE
jgi:hypothetical protein